MPGNRFAKRKDGTQAEIEKALRDAGYVVLDTSWAGRGLMDVMAGSACNPPLTLLVECKSPGGKMSPAELKTHATFPGNWIIADSGACAVTQAMEIRAQHLAGRSE